MSSPSATTYKRAADKHFRFWQSKTGFIVSAVNSLLLLALLSYAIWRNIQCGDHAILMLNAGLLLLLLLSVSIRVVRYYRAAGK